MVNLTCSDGHTSNPPGMGGSMRRVCCGRTAPDRYRVGRAWCDQCEVERLAMEEKTRAALAEGRGA